MTKEIRMRRILVFVISVVLSGCVFNAKEASRQSLASKCKEEMVTKKLVLDQQQLKDFELGRACSGANGQALACLVAMGAVVPAASFVVSGSIVLIGNTLHWAEYTARC